MVGFFSCVKGKEPVRSWITHARSRDDEGYKINKLLPILVASSRVEVFLSENVKNRFRIEKERNFH